VADINLPKQDSATGRGLKTAVQAMIGFTVGLLFTVWAVPGVPAAVLNYVQDNAIKVLLLVGVPSGLTSFVWNLFRKNIPNY
jgi:hypothetical protein